MELKELLKQSALKHAEAFASGFVGECYDAAIVEAKEAVKKAIPGQVDDMIIDLVVQTLAPELKKQLLEKIALIHKEA